MPSVVSETALQSTPVHQTLVNDCVIRIATANGSGSQSANNILMRAIFRMGVPVSSKNLFPSNIEGLPTWFSIRVNEHGWLARRAKSDINILMNPQSVEQDLAELEPGTIVILNDTLNSFVKRDDLLVYPCPFAAMVKEVCPDTRLRKKVVNMLYVGVAAWLLDIDLAEVETAVNEQFARKKKAVDLNFGAVRAAHAWATENLERQDRVRLERRDKTQGKIVIEGNEAAALGMLFGGVSLLAWYPITPSSSLCEALARLLDKYRKDPETGKSTYAVIQAEDEIASIGMVLGAGWMGARSMTATSGPGISLMAEMAGFSYFAEIPGVIVDVQRMGPSTGLPTRTSQGDILSAYYLSHGDTRHVLLIPGTVQECYQFALQSLDMAERLQTLIFVMSDLDLGMNRWMSDRFEYPDAPIDRGKVLSREDLDRLGDFQRYRDVDADGIDYRTLPGTDHPRAGYFTRGTGHNEKAEYSESARDWKANMDRLARKWETARKIVPRPIVDGDGSAPVGIIAYGSSDLAVQEARDILRSRHGVETDYLRIRALPINGEVRNFLDRYDTVYVVDQNRDAQMAQILRGEYPEVAGHVRSIRHYDGLPIDALTIVDQLIEQEQK